MGSKVGIIGAGPAGLFAAHEIAERTNAEIHIFDQGRSMSHRRCPSSSLCVCDTCGILCGGGGAGGFSDGKITLSPLRGVHGERVFTGEQEDLLKRLDESIVRWGTKGTYTSPQDVDMGDIPVEYEQTTYPLRHIGSDGMQLWSRRFVDHLEQKHGVVFDWGVQITGLVSERGGGKAVQTKEGRYAFFDTIMLATGLAGTPWLEAILGSLGVQLQANHSADIGIRLEARRDYLNPLLRYFYDFKVEMEGAQGIKFRSFCVNGGGYIVNERHSLGFRTVNGASMHSKSTRYSNMAILATIPTSFHTHPRFKVRQWAARMQMDEYPMRQRLGEFMRSGQGGVIGYPGAAEPTNPKTREGDVREAMLPVLAEGFTSFIQGLQKAAPLIVHPDNWVYAPELKYWAYKVPVSEDWEIGGLPGIYALGNASGHTASFSGAALSGMVAGRGVAAKVN